MAKGLTDTALRVIGSIRGVVSGGDPTRRQALAGQVLLARHRKALGTYLESLKLLRERRDAIRSQVAQGIDPSAPTAHLQQATSCCNNHLAVIGGVACEYPIPNFHRLSHVLL